MAKTPKRLKKNISFSAHEKDIYDYLEEQDNASAFVKRLITNQMMLDRGIATATVVKFKAEKITDEEETIDEEDACETLPEPQLKDVISSEKVETIDEEEPEISEDEVEKEDEEPTVPMNFTEEDLQTIELLPEL